MTRLKYYDLKMKQTIGEVAAGFTTRQSSQGAPLEWG